ncbi:hypothetical protein Tco_0237913 [Tanacetum coccineum]
MVYSVVGYSFTLSAVCGSNVTLNDDKSSVPVGLELGVFPLMCGWWIDFYTIRMFGKSMGQRVKFFSASELASLLIHWVGSESDELAATSSLDDDVNFYQMADSNVAKLFHIDSDEKHPALVLLKKDVEKVTHHVPRVSDYRHQDRGTGREAQMVERMRIGNQCTANVPANRPSTFTFIRSTQAPTKKVLSTHALPTKVATTHLT